jgi:curved DNA-binding protein CbpA
MGIPDMRTGAARARPRPRSARHIALDGAIGCDNYSRSVAVEYDPRSDHYVALGVGSMASHDEIKKAHRALIRELHPDCGGDAMPAAQVNIARDVLLNPVTRDEYDHARREWHEQHLLASVFTEAGMQIHRERTQARASTAPETAPRNRQRASARARAGESPSHAGAVQPGSSANPDPHHAAEATAQPRQDERSGSAATDWQPYLARALLAGRFFRTDQDRRSFAAGVAIGAANLLDNIIKNRVGGDPALREVVDMLSHAIWTEHVRVSNATAEQRTGRGGDPARRRVIVKRKKTRDRSSKRAQSDGISRTAATPRGRNPDKAPRRRGRDRDSGRRPGSD